MRLAAPAGRVAARNDAILDVEAGIFGEQRVKRIIRAGHRVAAVLPVPARTDMVRFRVAVLCVVLLCADMMLFSLSRRYAVLFERVADNGVNQRLTAFALFRDRHDGVPFPGIVPVLLEICLHRPSVCYAFDLGIQLLYPLKRLPVDTIPKLRGVL